MSVVSGVISRQVLAACGSLCFFCPAMRARSRQPVKRYKKLIADIFPRSQEEEPNDRKIGKLCEYASKNPLRIPKGSGIAINKLFSRSTSCERKLFRKSLGSTIYCTQIEVLDPQGCVGGRRGSDCPEKQLKTKLDRRSYCCWCS